MMNTYGIVNVAEKNYIRFVKSLISFKNCSKRIFLFGSFMELHHYHEGDFEFYLKGLYFIFKKGYNFLSS